MGLSSGKRLPVVQAAETAASSVRERLEHARGPEYWRCLEELAGTPEWKEALERELPKHAAVFPEGVNRRRFIELLGASLGLAGLTSCTTQPPETIVPYVRQPEQIVPGKPLFYATAMVHEGYATGLLAESHMGRPTKVEGNPDHPASLGATDHFAQASVLSLYDPDRAQVVLKNGRISTWERFTGDLTSALNGERAGGGAGIRILTETITSPTLAEQIRAFLRAYPNARWHTYQASNRQSAREGARLAFGRPLDARYSFADADVVLSLDADFLACGPGNLAYARDFTKRRKGGAPAGMNRLYAIESTPTSTSTLADHRLPVRPGEVLTFAMMLAAELGIPGADRPAGATRPELAKWATAIARDLRTRPGRGLVIAGDQASPGTHVIAHAINAALGNAGRTVVYAEPVEANPVDPVASLRELTDAMRAGQVSTLIVIGGNPAFTAPADLGFTEALTSVRMRVHHALYHDETSAHCHWHVQEAHYLEAWGDALSFDGTVTFIQPIIEPLFGGRSANELVAAMNGEPKTPGLDILRAYWGPRLAGDRPDQAEAAWRKALHDGFLPNSATPPVAAAFAPDALRQAAAELAANPVDPEGYDLVLRPDPTIDDGRFANNGWLQELPKPHTKITWDNAALMAPKMAERLGLQHGDVVELRVGDRAVKIPVTILPGQPDRVVTAHFGYGRSRSGRVGTGVGFNVYPLRTSGSMWYARGLSIKPTGERYKLASTQKHFSLEGRAIVRTATIGELIKDPHIIHEMAEAPPPHMTLYPGWKYDGYAWGMAIDIGSCIGCNACVVACQAENNIPIVGKEQVLNSREMHWLRIDRYYQGPPDNPEMHNQPMMCVHCEQAPCEVVCPVAATSHSAEGLNEMTYNRCVGTKYCSNNCPYKVRRFNFFQWQDTETEVLKLGRNPDVTVRALGVMEKCTYCVQRISGARIQAEREHRRVRDGEIVTACAQACPTDAIVFGDINDQASRVHALKKEPRAYGTLEELNTRPRSSHMAKIKNPNPELGES